MNDAWSTLDAMMDEWANKYGIQDKAFDAWEEIRRFVCNRTPLAATAPAMTEPVRVGVCPNCCAVLGVPDSVRTYKDGRVRMYWECCGISVMSPAKAATLDARFQQQKSDVPGTKLGLECVNQCGHTPDANTACWCCVEKALAKQLAELRGRIPQTIEKVVAEFRTLDTFRGTLNYALTELLNS